MHIWVVLHLWHPSLGCAAVEQSHKVGPPLALCLAASLVSPVPHASSVWYQDQTPLQESPRFPINTLRARGSVPDCLTQLPRPVQLI